MSSIPLLHCPVLLHSPICMKVLPSPLSTHVSVVTVNMMQECFIRNHIMSCLKHMPSGDVKNILWHLLINFDISIDFILQYNLQNCSWLLPHTYLELEQVFWNIKLSYIMYIIFNIIAYNIYNDIYTLIYIMIYNIHTSFLGAYLVALL
jgi:hypothetical protein